MCTRRTHALQRSRTSIGDHESTSEGKPSSGGWSGLAAFYHILLYMRERFFPPWHHHRLLSSLLRVRRGGWSLRISLVCDALDQFLSRLTANMRFTSKFCTDRQHFLADDLLGLSRYCHVLANELVRKSERRVCKKKESSVRSTQREIFTKHDFRILILAAVTNLRFTDSQYRIIIGKCRI